MYSNPDIAPLFRSDHITVVHGQALDALPAGIHDAALGALKEVIQTASMHLMKVNPMFGGPRLAALVLSQQAARNGIYALTKFAWQTWQIPLTVDYSARIDDHGNSITTLTLKQGGAPLITVMCDAKEDAEGHWTVAGAMDVGILFLVHVLVPLAKQSTKFERAFGLDNPEHDDADEVVASILAAIHEGYNTLAGHFDAFATGGAKAANEYEERVRAGHAAR